MRGQKQCAVFVMLIGLGALVPGSAAWAGYDYEQDGGNWGGYHIGPFGQWLGGPAYRPLYWGYHYRHRGAYAYQPRYRYRYWRYNP